MAKTLNKLFQMPRSSKPRHPYNKLRLQLIAQRVAMRDQAVSVFKPLLSIIDEMEHDGTTDSARGVPVLLNQQDGHYYELAPTIIGLVEMFEIHQMRSGQDLGHSILRTFATMLDHGMPVTPADTTKVRKTIATMISAIEHWQPSYAKELADTVETRALLEGSISGPIQQEQAA